MSSMREVFERRADELCIPYTHMTLDPDLVALVLAQEQLDLRHVKSIPTCFGALWEADQNPLCQGCQVQTACLHKMAHDALPQAVHAVGGVLPKALADHMGIEISAVRFAVEFAELLEQQKDTGALSPPNESPKSASTKPPSPAQSLPKKKKTPKSSSRKTSAKNASAPASKSAASIAKTASAPAVSAAPTSQTDPLPPRAVKKKPTRTPKVPWGEHTFMNRWLRERETFPMLILVQPGQTIRRTYLGRKIEVRVQVGYYIYDKQKFPTLYSIVKEVTGAVAYPKAPDATGVRPQGQRSISNWSATRFFALAVREAAGC